MYLSDIVAGLKGSGACDPTCKVYAECDKHGNSELAEQLDSLRPGEKAGFLALLKLVAIHGPKHVPAATRHEIDKKAKIYEFIKGNHRIPWFFDGGNVVICSHVFRKKRQKTPSQDVEQTKRLRERYLEAKESGQLKIWADNKERTHG